MLKSFFYFGMLFFLFSCKKEKAATTAVQPIIVVSQCDSINSDFITQIQPIFVTSCAVSGCHNSAANAAGYTFETYAQISGNYSIAMSTIKAVSGFSPMPKFSAKLPDSTIQKIDCWINNGTPQ